ncbi:MAG: LysE family transporter [Anaerolineaceae bacterium]|nr:LysE family transporter [Anaerolineaceae bacterium]
MLDFIVRGSTLGWSAGFIPSPLQGYLINTTLAQGWRRSVLVMGGLMLSDLPVVVLMVVVLKQFPPEAIRLVQLVGGAFLLWIAYGAWQQYRANVTIGPGEQALPGRRSVLLKSMMMNWLSPVAYIFWGTITGPVLVEGLAQSVWHGLAFLLAFYGTFMAIWAALILVFNRMRTINPRVTRLLMLGTIILLVVFALSLIAQGLGLTGVV